jgi:hypothetical protein
LLTARVTKSTQIGKAGNSSWRLTLSDGISTHDAVFKNSDQHEAAVELATGATESNFVDSYKYDIAAYLLAELLAMDDTLPVTVERKWQGASGALSWWLPGIMNASEGLKRQTPPPDPEALDRQMYKIRVFDELIYDTDANLTNMLIGPRWQLWRIDFGRAFRQNKKLQNPKNLVRCDGSCSRISRRWTGTNWAKEPNAMSRRAKCKAS